MGRGGTFIIFCPANDVICSFKKYLKTPYLYRGRSRLIISVDFGSIITQILSRAKAEFKDKKKVKICRKNYTWNDVNTKQTNKQ